MRISNWSSDVCSSDLGVAVDRHHLARHIDRNVGIRRGVKLHCVVVAAVEAARLGGALRRRAEFHDARPRRSEHLESRPLEMVVGEGLGEGLPRFFQKSRSEEHTSELQSLMRISYAVFCLKK